MHTKKILSVLFILLFSFTLFALPSVSDYFPSFSEEKLQQLLSGETFKAYTVDGQSTSEIAPVGTVSAELAEKTEGIGNAFSQALVSFVPYPESWSDFSEDEKHVAIFNLMQKVSTMKGITYDSYSAGGEATLFSEAYMIKNPNKKNSKINDPIYSEVPGTVESYAFMKDTKFGGNVYKLNYYNFENEMYLEITNDSNMKYLGVSCVKSNALHMYVDAVMAEEGVVVYGIAICYNQKPSVKVLVTTVDLPSAFLKRVSSLKNWFVLQVKEQ